MDGNRRFAKSTGESVLDGHLAGKDKFLEVVEWVTEAKIEQAVFYVFSTENWKRSEAEVGQLLELMLLDLRGKLAVKIKVIGQLSALPLLVQENIARHELANLTTESETTVYLALAYGGRDEIMAAVNQAIVNGKAVDEAEFKTLLWSSAMADPDLIIRTGGEERLSNFLPWQSIYSELFFSKTLWPAFTKVEFQRILSDYAIRDRRIGK